VRKNPISRGTGKVAKKYDRTVFKTIAAAFGLSSCVTHGQGTFVYDQQSPNVRDGGGGRVCYYEDLETAKRELVENVTWLAERNTG
jgi:hypothetical protein